MKLVHRFLIHPAPNWRNITLLELQRIIAIPWISNSSSLKPSIVTLPPPPSTSSSSSFSSPSPHESPATLSLLSPSNILLTNCSYYQAMEICSRLLTIHDIEWILLSKKCTNRQMLNSFLKKFSLEHILSFEEQRSMRLVCYANRSFVNSSSLLKELFSKYHPVSNSPISSILSSSNLSTTSDENHCANTIQSRDKGQVIHRLKISLLENYLTITLSFGGNELPLFKRGYKFSFIDAPEDHNLTESSSSSPVDTSTSKKNKGLAIAPLAEHHAASCFLYMLYSNCLLDKEKSELNISSIDGERYHHLMKNIDRIVVPFAGSGTLGFEAALIIHGVGSGAIQKRHFAYHQFLSTPPESLNVLRDISFKCMTSNSSPMRIYFSDINSDAINALKNNISSFQQSITREDESPLNSSPSIFEIPKQIDFFQCSLDQLVPITQNRMNQTMVLLLNPPYGLRLGKKSSPILLYQKVSRRVLDIYAHLCSNQSVTRNESNIEEVGHVPIMMGYCICSNQNTASLFTQGLDGKFNCHMHSFSHGGKERYVVSFISIK